MHRNLVLLGLFFLPAMAGEAALAQGFEGGGDQRYLYNRGGFYTYADPGDITITVNVWGNVRFPGLYQLREGTTLSEVISYCGSSEETTLLSTRRTRQTVVKVSRLDANGARRVVFEEDLRELVYAPSIPVVVEGDVVLIDVIESERLNWRDLVPVGGVVLGAANLILAVIALNR